MCRQTDGQISRWHDRLSDHAGECDLRRGDQILFLVWLIIALRDTAGHPEHVITKLGQLPRAKQRRSIDDIRRIALGVTVLGRLQIEHELGQRTVQSCHGSAHETETRTRKFACHIKIQTQPCPELYMIFDFKGRRPRIAISAWIRHPAPDFDIVFTIRTIRYRVAGHVGDHQQQVVELCLKGQQVLFKLFELARDRL